MSGEKSSRFVMAWALINDRRVIGILWTRRTARAALMAIPTEQRKAVRVVRCRIEVFE